MFDYLKDYYEYYFDYSKYIKNHQLEHHKQSVPVNEQHKKELILKKNDGYKNINTNKVLEIIFDPIDI